MVKKMSKQNKILLVIGILLIIYLISDRDISRRGIADPWLIFHMNADSQSPDDLTGHVTGYIQGDVVLSDLTIPINNRVDGPNIINISSYEFFDYNGTLKYSNSPVYFIDDSSSFSVGVIFNFRNNYYGNIVEKTMHPREGGWKIYHISDKIIFYIANSSESSVNGYNGRVDIESFLFNQWNYVIFTRNGTDKQLKSYLNNQLQQTSYDNLLGMQMYNNSPLIIGGWFFDWQYLDYTVDGYIYEVKIWDKTLTEEEIYEEYAMSFVPHVNYTSCYFHDNDNDGYYRAGFNCYPEDCNDNDPDINPGATEICGNGIDEDCDGISQQNSNYYRDLDNDTYGDPSHTYVGCGSEHGYVLNNLDCNDGNPNINPGVAEICNNSIDDNCDGIFGIPTIYYLDYDKDGYGDLSNQKRSCTPLSGYVTNRIDCNDKNSSINPGKSEICGNSVDENCDTIIENCTTITTNGTSPGVTTTTLSTTPDITTKKYFIMPASDWKKLIIPAILGLLLYYFLSLKPKKRRKRKKNAKK